MIVTGKAEGSSIRISVGNIRYGGLALKMNTRKLFALFAPAALLLALSTAGVAGPIVGSQPLGSSGVSDDLGGGLGDILLASAFTTATYIGNPGTGDFSAYPLSFIANGDNTQMDVSAGPGASSFTISDLVWGTFTATTLVYDTPGIHARAFGFLGNFTPGSSGAYPAGVTSDTASLIVTLNQSGGAGNSISESLTLNTPAADLGAPEPATMSLFGGALVGLGLLGRKRFARR
jgi:hypothetical protein